MVAITTVPSAITRQNRPSGYGVIRAFRIGPLFADSPTEAQALFNALQTTIPENSPIFIDIPEPNGKHRRWIWGGVMG